MEKEEFLAENKNKIVLSDELQDSILKFFMKTSIPRKAKQEREKQSPKLPSDFLKKEAKKEREGNITPPTKSSR